MEELRAIVGDAPSDELLRRLLRDNSVEAAANKFFDGSVSESATVAAPAPAFGKRAMPAAPAPPERQRQKTAAAAAETSDHHSIRSAAETSDHHSIRSARPAKPLAERMRPTSLEQLLGQSDALDAVLKQAIRNDRLPSLVLWGPPGCGKTSFASCVAASTRSIFRSLSAATAGVKELRDELSRAANARRLRGVGTILFVDELHRWSKAQQDALLLDVERGTVTLIGATTENPSFSLNNAILSRCRLVIFSKISAAAIRSVIDNALGSDASLQGTSLTDGARRALVAAADGDARVALNTLELAAEAAAAAAATAAAPEKTHSGGGVGEGEGEGGEAGIGREGGEAGLEHQGGEVGGRGVTSWRVVVDEAAVLAAVQRRATYYDRNGEFHYDLISALHKSMRGGDADGALYYTCRMLAGGEEPRYLTRRLIRFASEDVGLADPLALSQAVAADQAAHAIGMPECGVCIGQCAVYLALAPKSCAVYRGYSAAMAAATEEPSAPVPLHLRNAPTRLMKSIGYGGGYEYNPGKGYERGCPQGYLPPELGVGRSFFNGDDCEPGHALCFAREVGEGVTTTAA
jgi:putative ATPase